MIITDFKKTLLFCFLYYPLNQSFSINRILVIWQNSENYSEIHCDLVVHFLKLGNFKFNIGGDKLRLTTWLFGLLVDESFQDLSNGGKMSKQVKPRIERNFSDWKRKKKSLFMIRMEIKETKMYQNETAAL